MKKVLSSMPAQAALLLVLGCVTLVTLVPGCGDNPTGPSGGSSSVSPTTTPSVSSGTATVYGQIVDQDSNLPIQDSNAQIVVQLFKENTLVKSQTALGNNSFVFTDLTGGIYTLYAYDAAAAPVYSKNFSVVQATVNTAVPVNLKLMKTPTAPASSRLTFFGRLIDSQTRAPVMDASVSIGSPGAVSPSFQTSTLESGYFFLFDISSGTWEIKFGKGGYEESTETLVATATTITFNNKNVTYDNVGQKNGTGTVIVGYNLGDVEIAPNALLVGAIKGVVHDIAAPFAALPAGTGLNIFYRRDLSDTSPISYIVRGVTTNAEGYISVENLPAGYYGIGAINTFPQAILNANGDIVGWSIAGGNVYVDVALRVTPGKTTLIPTGAR